MDSCSCPTPPPPILRHLSFQWPKTRDGRNQRRPPKKVSRREIRPSHSGNSGSGPAVNHRPPCLFPSPRPTSVCVCVLTTWVTPDTSPCPMLDPLLLLALGTSQQYHQDPDLLRKMRPVKDPRSQIPMFGGHQSLGLQSPGQPILHPPSPRQKYPVRQAHRAKDSELECQTPYPH